MNGRPERVFGPLDRASYNAWWAIEHVLTGRRMGALAHRLRATLHQRMRRVSAERSASRVISVDRRVDLDGATFRSEYFRRARPVVLAGLADGWPATEQWTLDWLAREYPEDRVCITDHGDPDFIPLSVAVDRIGRGEAKLARFGGLLHDHPELSDGLRLAELSRFMPPWARRTSLQFFVAAAGAVSPLHADGTCNFHIQIRGEKVWRIIEPRFNPVMQPAPLGAPHFKSPLRPFEVGNGAPDAPPVDVLEAVLEPGDVLFNPSFFWHEVRYRQPSVSVGVRWVSPTSFLRGSPMMSSLMLLAQDPTVFEALLKARTGKIEGFYR